MMTPEIEKQLIEWSGRNRELGSVTLRGVLFATEKGNLVIFEDGDVTYSGVVLPSKWKTLDDIIRVLDVFGVKRKEPPKWNHLLNHPHIVKGPGVYATFYRPDSAFTTPNSEAAAEYAAWKNSQEG